MAIIKKWFHSSGAVRSGFKGVIKLFEGLPKFMRVSREGLTLLECQFMRVWFEGLV